MFSQVPEVGVKHLKGAQKICLSYSPNKPMTVKQIVSNFPGMDRLEKGPKEVFAPELQKDLLLLEEQEGSVNFKFGVLYMCPGQTSDDQILSNEPLPHGAQTMRTTASRCSNLENHCLTVPIPNSTVLLEAHLQTRLAWTLAVCVPITPRVCFHTGEVCSYNLTCVEAHPLCDPSYLLLFITTITTCSPSPLREQILHFNS
ncbi:Rap GTPase activating protein domain [Trinorchestia longiramus]|nr:Rap GTPase activating protein domain [Trinorchestia longiramus]